MSEPGFRDLVGDDLPEAERARLERVHALLVQAGPPPELPPDLASAPRPGEERVAPFLPKRRRGLSIALAAAVGVTAFALGTVWGREDADFDGERTVLMRGVGAEEDAAASIEIAAADPGGNYPMVMRVRGLEHLSRRGDYYELLITVDGEPVGTCGVFNVRADGGPTEVRLSVPYRLESTGRYDGWVVVVNSRGERGEPVLESERV